MVYYQNFYGKYFEEEGADLSQTVQTEMNATQNTNTSPGKQAAKRLSFSATKDEANRRMSKFGPVPVTKHPRTSLPVDLIDPVYHHFDPISVSLQERVKVGGHITSVTKKPYHKVPFYFHLSEKDECDHVSKRAILSAEIEFEEGRDKTKKVK